VNDPITVLICDDHRVVRDGLRRFLELHDDLDVVGEAATGAEAVTLVSDTLPDVVLMDLVMPDTDGIEATRVIREISPSTRVLVLTSFATDEKVFPAIKAGAAGYLLKDVEPDDLAEAIRTVHAGEALLHPRVAAKVMRELSDAPSSESRPGGLTDREVEVLRLVARGMANKQIASELGVALKTVKTHVSNVLMKLHLADRTQAALYAVREGIVDPDDDAITS